MLCFTIHLRTCCFSFRDFVSSFLVYPVNISIVGMSAFEFEAFLNVPLLTSSFIRTLGSALGIISAISKVFLTPVLLFLYWTIIIEMAGSIDFGISIGAFVSLVTVSSAL